MGMRSDCKYLLNASISKTKDKNADFWKISSGKKKDKLGVHISLFSKVVAIFKVEGY